MNTPRLITTKAGTAVWQLAYTLHGKRRTASLGISPAVTPAMAEQRAAIVRSQVAQGLDPTQAKAATRVRAAATVCAVCHEWMARQDYSPVWARTVASLIDQTCAQFGAQPIGLVTPMQMLGVLQTVEARAPVQAIRLRGILGQVWRYAVATGRAERDITADLRDALTAPPVQHRQGPRTIEQLRDLLAQCGDNRYLRALAHTFVRPGELLGFQPCEIDGDVWRIPASRMKSGREHWVPVTAATRELLTAPFDHSMQTYRADLKAAGGEHLHGFRSAASTILHGLGYAPHLIELQLAHTIGSSTARAYNHAAYLPERREMMQNWSQLLQP